MEELNSSKSPEGGFQSSEFIYNDEDDSYTCPVKDKCTK